MIIILFGAPGVGKGTQAQLLVNEFKWQQLSTGEILRKHIKNETEIGLKVKSVVESGELVSDELLGELVEAEVLESKAETILFDGFPRNTNQADMLTKKLKLGNHAVKGVFHIDVPTKSLVDRLSGRRVCKNCNANFHVKFQPPKTEGVCDQCQGELILRKDDEEDKVLRRLEIYEKETQPVIDYYKTLGNYWQIDGNASSEEVNARLKASFKDVQVL